ncbi:hypothetical protein PI124_g12032 [Phytophthora idaei]|nr:hypothetical protein PI124_g12032 [Phytophthora idaei]
MPLYQRVPKRSFNSKFATPMETVNLDKLQLFVDIGRLDTSNKITIRSSQHLTAKLDIEISQVSESAFKAVEAAAQKFEMPPQPARPNPKKLTYYTNYSHLSPEIQVKKALANASKSK